MVVRNADHLGQHINWRGKNPRFLTIYLGSARILVYHCILATLSRTLINPKLIVMLLLLCVEYWDGLCVGCDDERDHDPGRHPPHCC